MDLLLHMCHIPEVIVQLMLGKKPTQQEFSVHTAPQEDSYLENIVVACVNIC
jgi:hypothetical protein